MSMRELMTAHGIGKRIKAARARRGIASMAALVDLAGTPNVTPSMLMNIESGRQENITVAQLLNIAWALKISPLLLIAAYGRPDDPLDLPGLSPELAALTNAEFDDWVTGERAPASKSERDENTDIHLLRERRRLAAEVERVAVAAALERHALHSDVAEGLGGFREQLEALQAQTARIETHLQQDGWTIPAAPAR